MGDRHRPVTRTHGSGRVRWSKMLRRHSEPRSLSLVRNACASTVVTGKAKAQVLTGAPRRRDSDRWAGSRFALGWPQAARQELVALRPRRYDQGVAPGSSRRTSMSNALRGAAELPSCPASHRRPRLQCRLASSFRPDRSWHDRSARGRCEPPGLRSGAAARRRHRSGHPSERAMSGKAGLSQVGRRPQRQSPLKRMQEAPIVRILNRPARLCHQFESVPELVVLRQDAADLACHETAEGNAVVCRSKGLSAGSRVFFCSMIRGELRSR